jgi:hypothetical protein
MTRVTCLIFWAAVAFTLVMATLPKPPHLPGSPSDKVQHILAFMCLAALGSAAYSRTPALRLAVSLAAVGGLIELLQLIPVLNRDSEWLDWLADVAAAGVVLLAISVWRRGRPNRPIG